jgi:prepilin-type N-terminal cleavage/methylation domain-containing protein
MNEGSFTLLELLLVMVIVAVLASLIASSTAKAKIQAQKVACRVAIRSYVVGMLENTGRYIVVIPEEANCHDCHKPRYNAGLYLDQLAP